MKKDISGIRVFSSNSKLGRKEIGESCRTAELILEEIKDYLNINPIESLNKIEIYRNSEYSIIESVVMADFENIETGIFEKREVIKYNNATMLTYYLPQENSIQFDDRAFYPLNKITFLHEFGHIIYEKISDYRKQLILELYNTLKAVLIKKIKAGNDPIIESDAIFSTYSFMHNYGMGEGNVICFPGYVGKLIRMQESNNLSTTINAYTFQRDEEEFFSEAFAAFFCEPNKLRERNLYNLFYKILSSKV